MGDFWLHAPKTGSSSSYQTERGIPPDDPSDLALSAPHCYKDPDRKRASHHPSPLHVLITKDTLVENQQGVANIDVESSFGSGKVGGLFRPR